MVERQRQTVTVVPDVVPVPSPVPLSMVPAAGLHWNKSFSGGSLSYNLLFKDTLLTKMK